MKHKDQIGLGYARRLSQLHHLCHRPRRQSLHGFTLIELLVVIAIISLLVSILLPSLQKAKELAHGTVCLSNMNGLGLAMMMYLDENDNYLPAARKKDGRYWPYCMKLSGVIEDFSATYCPGGGGTYKTNALTSTNPTAVYGFNNAPWYHGGGWQTYELSDFLGAKRYTPARMTREERPADTPLLGDTVSYGEVQWFEWQCACQCAVAEASSGIQGNKGLHTRHCGRGNVLFADGHCESWTVEDAWDCQWHPMGATDIP